MTVHIHHGDMREVLPILGRRFHSVVTDPPYHLASIVRRFSKSNPADVEKNATARKIAGQGTSPHGRAARGFMGKEWDGGDIAFRPETWALVGSVMLPGAHLVAFAGTKGAHRMACAIEDAGFEIRDTLAWLYGSGFPKSHDAAKAMDKHLGTPGRTVPQGEPVKRMIPGADQHKGGWKKDNGREYQPGSYMPGSEEAAEWEGWGTALKPAYEPIVLARWPMAEKTVAANLAEHRCGALNVDACRIEGEKGWPASESNFTAWSKEGPSIPTPPRGDGRWPANVVHDGSEEVLAAFPETGAAASGGRSTGRNFGQEPADAFRKDRERTGHDDLGGSAARFFFSAKADATDRMARDIEEVEISWISEQGPCLAKLRADTGQSPERATVALGPGESSEWSKFLNGSGISDLCRRASKSTTRTGTNSTTASGTWKPLLRSITSASTAAASSGTENGGSHAESAAANILSATIIVGRTESLPGASRALSGTPLRISVSAKRQGTLHPTVKPVDLMRWLVRLVTPKGGHVLDPFAGSGTTGMACMAEGVDCTLIEREAEYAADIRRRIAHVSGDDTPLFVGAAE